MSKRLGVLSMACLELVAVALASAYLTYSYPKLLFVVSAYCLVRFYQDSSRPCSPWLYVVIVPSIYNLFFLGTPQDNTSLPLYFLLNPSFYMVTVALSLMAIYYFSYSWKDIVLVQLLFLFPFQFFWRVFSLNANDHAVLFSDGRILWQKFYEFSLMKHGFLPFWNHFSNNGIATYFDNVNMISPYYPVNFIILSCFYNANMLQFYQAMAFCWIMMISVGLSGMYTLLRHFRLNRYAAIGGAFAYAFSTYVICWVPEAAIVSTYMFCPWAAIAFLRILEEPNTRNLAFSVVVCFCLAFLPLAFVYLLAIGLLIITVGYSVLHRKKVSPKSFFFILLAGVVAYALAGFYTIPVSDNVINGDMVRSLPSSYDYAVKSYQSFGMLVERYLDFHANYTDDSNMHMGVVVSILSLFYLFAFKDRIKPVFLCMFCFFFLLSTAHLLFPRDMIYLYVPGLAHKKMQTTLSFLQLFPVAYFSGYVIHKYSEERGNYSQLNVLIRPLLVVSVVVFLFLIFAEYEPIDKSLLFNTVDSKRGYFVPIIRDIDIKIFNALFAMLCLFSLYFLRRKALSAALCVLIFLELTSIAKINVNHRAPLFTQDHTHYHTYTDMYMKRNFSLEPLCISGKKVNQGKNFMGQFLNNQISVDGYNTYAASHHYMLMASFGGGPPYEYDMGIHEEHMQPYEPFRAMAKNPAKFRELFFNKRVALYRDFSVLNIDENENQLDYELRILREIDSSDIDTKLILSDINEKKVLGDMQRVQEMSGLRNLRGSVDDNVRFLPSTYNTINLAISNTENSMLFINTNYHHHWRAYIQGIEVPIYRGHFNFMAIPIPVGEFEIEMKFIPRYFYLGLLVSLTTLQVLVLVTVLLVYGKRKSFSWTKYALVVFLLMVPYVYFVVQAASVRNLSSMDRPPQKVYEEIKVSDDKLLKEELFLKHGPLMSSEMRQGLEHELGCGGQLSTMKTHRKGDDAR